MYRWLDLRNMLFARMNLDNALECEGCIAKHKRAGMYRCCTKMMSVYNESRDGWTQQSKDMKCWKEGEAI